MTVIAELVLTFNF